MVLNDFRLARNRAGGFRSDVAARGKRRAGTLAALALELFVHGMGAGGVRRAFEKIGVKVYGLSKSTVSEKHFDEVLQNLISRGSDVDRGTLVTADGAGGPINSIVSRFGEKKLRRCVVRRTRNILEKCPGNMYDEPKAKVARLWNRPSRLTANHYLETLVAE
ncbi:MAG TPA: hypothetical protein ENN79_15590 [Desulfobacteraceae bacterium]|nr:hypothetical protein [Desulfobacteraceae bacterium]